MNVSVSTDRIAKSVRASLEAAELRGLLLKHLHDHKSLITYLEAAKVLGRFSASLGGPLGMLQDDDAANGRPLISSLVVSSTTGEPSPGYFSHARSLGFNIPVGGERAFWCSQLALLSVTLTPLPMAMIPPRAVAVASP
jgi:hypothetical protein